MPSSIFLKRLVVKSRNTESAVKEALGVRRWEEG